MPGMHHRQDVIDGAKTPDLIPDSTAYRLFLITVSEVSNPTSEQLSRQIAFLKTAGLDEDDINSAIPILAKFKSEYGDLIEAYNKTVDDANEKGVAPDIGSFLRSREQLVRRTRDALAAVLSSNGMTHISDHVQHEKTKMKVAAMEGQ